MSIETVAMRGRTVSLVLTKTIGRVQGIKRSHHLVPMHFGNDRGRADGCDPGITADDGIAVDLPAVNHQVGQSISINFDQ